MATTGAVGELLDALHFFVEPQRDAVIAQVVAERLDDFLSANSSRRGRFSIRMTRTPSAANMHAYSTPITPPPTTMSVLGSSASSRT